MTQVFLESLIRSSNSSIMRGVQEKRLQVSLFGGSLAEESADSIASYCELGRVLREEDVDLATGPIVEKTYLEVVSSAFLEQQGGDCNLREFVPVGSVERLNISKKAQGRGRVVQEVNGGLPLVSASLVNPDNGLYLFCPPSVSSIGTFAEAAAALSHIENSIRREVAATRKPGAVERFPGVPKAVFISWLRSDRDFIESIVRKSNVLVSAPGQYEFFDIQNTLKNIVDIIAQQRKSFNKVDELAL